MKTVDIILQKVKHQGAVTTKQLSLHLGITTMGARQHLQSLENEGILIAHDVKEKVGRPTRHWSLTAKGHAQFSNRHGDLSVQLLDSIKVLYGEEELEKVTQQREQAIFERYSLALAEQATLLGKLQTLCHLRDQEGYMATLEETEQGFLFIEHHCPVRQAAEHCSLLCQSELRVFNQLLNNLASIERIAHLIQGQHHCVYQITPNLDS